MQEKEGRRGDGEGEGRGEGEGGGEEGGGVGGGRRGALSCVMFSLQALNGDFANSSIHV